MPDRLHPLHTIKDLGYCFNAKGELRTIEGDKPFKFTTQEDYELLGDAMTHEIYNLMEKVGLQRILLKKPMDNKPDDHYSFVFASPEFHDKQTLLILIHGMGAVRAGQWTRKLILNESLDRGSQLPYIERALTNGWGVLVTNANLNEHCFGDSVVPQPLQYSKSPENHMESVWYRFVRYTKAQNIYVVAHSRGGHDISNVMETFNDENRVSCICLTDSWFEFPENREQQPIVINWAARSKASVRRSLTGRSAYENRVHQIWAGTTEHERSSYCALESVFYVLENNPCERNIEQLLTDAWDIMDAPQLEAETDSFGQPRQKITNIISKDDEGNVKVNEDLFAVDGLVQTEDIAKGDFCPTEEEENIELVRSDDSEEDVEPSTKQPRLIDNE